MDMMRQIAIFDPTAYAQKSIDIIGAGASGSYAAWILAQTGLDKIRVWDDDIIEPHNIPNQMYGLNDIGKSKVEALRDLIKTNTGTEIEIRKEKITTPQKLNSIVFVMVDTMAARKQIWEQSIRLQSRIDMMIETRLGNDAGRVYAINPKKISQFKNWEKTLCSDDAAVVSACGTASNIAITVALLASMAVWQMIKALKGEEYENQLLVNCRPWHIHGTKY